MRTISLCGARAASLALFALCLAPATELSAEDRSDTRRGSQPIKVVVSANKIETPASAVGSAVSTIESETLERRSQPLVLDALRGELGVDVVQSGPPGGNAAVFLRGLNAEHTLLMIDGIEANNPVSNARFFNFADISLENVERIEILRGPQSTLYGSDAMGGVINIITKRGSGPPQLTASAEAGSYDTFIERLSLLGSQGIVDYSIGAIRQDIHGISSAAGEGNTEDDPYENTGVSARVGVTPEGPLSFAGYLRYNDTRSDLDNTGGPFGDDPNRVLENEQLFTAFEARAELLDGKLKPMFRIGYSDHEFTDDNDPDELHPSDLLRSRFRGDLLKLEMQNTAELAEWATLVVGIETEEETARSRFLSESSFGPFEDNFGPLDARSNGYFAQLIGTAGERFAASAGVRVDDHSEFGSEVTYRIAPAVFFPETGTKLSASVGTGFKAPSLFQLFSSFGNPELDAEESIGADGGIRQEFLGGKLAVETRYFWNDLDELITFDPQTFIFENIGDARTRGIESSIVALLPWDSRLTVNYTYTDTEDGSTGASLLRRARNKVGTELLTSLSEELDAGVRVVYTGPRFDTDFSGAEAARARLGGYTLVDLNASYKLTPEVTLFARVENVFDKEYEEVLGFGEPGVAAYGGIRLRLG